MEVLIVVVVLALIGLAMSVRNAKQYEKGVLFRFGRALGPRDPGLRLIVPFADVLSRVSLRIVTMPIQSQGIITRGNVGVDVSAVAYFRVVDAVRSVVVLRLLAMTGLADSFSVHASVEQAAVAHARNPSA